MEIKAVSRIGQVKLPYVVGAGNMAAVILVPGWHHLASTGRIEV